MKFTNAGPCGIEYSTMDVSRTHDDNLSFLIRSRHFRTADIALNRTQAEALAEEIIKFYSSKPKPKETTPTVVGSI